MISQDKQFSFFMLIKHLKEGKSIGEVCSAADERRKEKCGKCADSTN
jgi:hypothetical protein